jgi:hypothetical protein
MGIILANAILDVAVGDIIPYAIAAGVVLLPIAFLTDFYYRKHEPAKKTGVAMVIMVIHAVLFALLAIAALIVTVFNSLSALIEASNDIDEKLVAIFTAIGATLLYAATFIRVLNPFKSKKPVFAYSAAMVAVTLLLITFAIVGPLVQTLATKDDRRIEENLPSVGRGINSYIQTNKEVPASLDQVRFTDNKANLLVKDGLVRYKPEKSATSKYNASNIEHRYQLCATFKYKLTPQKGNYTYGNSEFDNSVFDNNPNYGPDDYHYINYERIAEHAKGEVCYKLQSTIQSDNLLDNEKGVNLKNIILN